MADEIKLNVGLRASKSTLQVEPTNITDSFDMSGTDYCSGTQIIGTAEEAITIGEITTPGYVLLQNLDAAINITVVFVTGQTNGILLEPGGFCLFKKSTTGLFAFSASGSPALKKVILEA